MKHSIKKRLDRIEADRSPLDLDQPLTDDQYKALRKEVSLFDILIEDPDNDTQELDAKTAKFLQEAKRRKDYLFGLDPSISNPWE